MDVKVANVIRRVRTRLSKKGAWTKGVLARNKNGTSADPCDASAVSWCILGAIEKETEYDPFIKCCIHELLNKALEENSIVGFEDYKNTLIKEFYYYKTYDELKNMLILEFNDYSNTTIKDVKTFLTKVLKNG